MKRRTGFWVAVRSVFYSLIFLTIIFLLATILWIWITPYTFLQYNLVLSLILKNSGSYSVLLVGLTITNFFQIYSREKDIEKEDKIKIDEVGYYTLAFQRSEDTYEEVFKWDKMIVEINEEEDYSFSKEKTKNTFPASMIKFLTSKEKSTNLKNIMAFSDEYMKNNSENILKKYYEYCERVTFSTPLYCSTKPTSELKNDNIADINRYFWIIVKMKEGNIEEIKNFWVSAVTEEGILLFIKVKARIARVNGGYLFSLIQQTTYYKSGERLYPLYR